MKFLENKMMSELVKEKTNQTTAVRKMILAIIDEKLALDSVFALES